MPPVPALQPGRHSTAAEDTRPSRLLLFLPASSVEGLSIASAAPSSRPPVTVDASFPLLSSTSSSASPLFLLSALSLCLPSMSLSPGLGAQPRLFIPDSFSYPSSSTSSFFQSTRLKEEPLPYSNGFHPSHPFSIFSSSSSSSSPSYSLQVDGGDSYVPTGSPRSPEFHLSSPPPSQVSPVPLPLPSTYPPYPFSSPLPPSLP